MVVLHFKKSEGNEFLYESNMQIKIDDLIKELCEGKYIFAFNFMVIVNNLRLKLDRAAIALEDLAAKGPLQPEGLRGLDEAGYAEYIKGEDVTVTDGLKAMPPKVGVRHVPDSTHYRTGDLISEEVT